MIFVREETRALPCAGAWSRLSHAPAGPAPTRGGRGRQLSRGPSGSRCELRDSVNQRIVKNLLLNQ